MFAESGVIKYGFQDHKNILIVKQKTRNNWQRVSFVERKQLKDWDDLVIYSS